MEAILLAGGKGARLGAAAEGLPKPLVPVARRPLAAYTLERLVAGGVTRVIVSCAEGSESLFDAALADLGVELAFAAESEPLGRGGALRHALRARLETGPVLAQNGDEILDLDVAALLRFHAERGAAATIVVAPMPSAFGVVELDEDDRVRGFREAPRLPHWVNAGLYVLAEEALARLPERGDHERSTFPELAGEGRLAAFRHEGVWLTVNTPKDLKTAEAHLTSLVAGAAT